ncbi:AAA family ATPase [Halomonas sp. MG34]|nr:AAA family ATPase [Halomonas sp. MG34]
MIIKKISIKNFRSVESCKIDIKDINIFAGCNDSGKSNFLKALNLFFNNKTDHDTQFDFKNDFCHFAKVPNKTASEIQIELTLTPPQHYADPREFVWRKKWREGAKEEYENKMYIPPSPKNEVHNSSKSWARKIRFRYVPAMKGDNYFPHLLRDLYNTLAISIDAELKKASGDFVSTISSHTLPMIHALNDQLKLESSIRLPENLSSLFEVLDFSTTHNGASVSINRRGDGVKIRHIPSILKFLHDEENRVRRRGSIKVNTIWGYEEPENNLEFLSASEKSLELLNMSDEIQMFISSHSPSFYSLKDESRFVKLFYTTQEDRGTRYISIDNDSDVELADEKMGLLPIVAPYIKNKEREIIEIRNSIKDLKDKQTHSAHTIFVEGKTDKKIIEYFLTEISEHELDVVVKSDVNAGSSWVRNNLVAWSMSPAVETSAFKAFGLLDNDKAGKKDHELYLDFMKYSGRRAHEGKVKSQKLRPTRFLTNILSEKGFKFDYAIEELFPPHVWRHAELEGWLEPRVLSDCYDISSLPNDKSLFRVVNEKFEASEEIIYLLNKVANNYKNDFSNYVIEKGQEEPEIFDGLSVNIKEVIAFFNK